MLEPLATMAPPSMPGEGILDAIVKAWPIILGVLTALWGAFKGWQNWRDGERARRAAVDQQLSALRLAVHQLQDTQPSEEDLRVRHLESKGLRYDTDALRQALHALCIMSGAETGVYDLAQLTRHRALVGDISDQLWIADGHEPREGRRRPLDVLTRTQAIQALDVRDGDNG